MEDFIKLHKGGMNVQDYSLKFTKLFKYDPYFVSNPIDEMRHFVIVVTDDLVEECHSEMLDDNMDISC